MKGNFYAPDQEHDWYKLHERETSPGSGMGDAKYLDLKIGHIRKFDRPLAYIVKTYACRTWVRFSELKGEK